MKQENNYLVYELVDHENNPFYIGKTKNLKQRMYEHWRLATKHNGKFHVCNKIRKLIKENNYTELKYNILFNNLSSNEAINQEIKSIKEFKDKGIKLTNLTDGGEGTPGSIRIFTDEWKNNLKLAKKKQYNEGYTQLTKGKTYEEIYGEKKSKEIKEISGKKISEGIKNGTINHNKNKKLEDIVGIERSKELKKINSNTAKNTFTGIKQSEEHINKRIQNQLITKQNWSKEQKEIQSIKNKQAAETSIKRNNIKIILPNNKEIILYASYIEITNFLLKEYNIICGEHSVSSILRNKAFYKNTKHKCNFIFV